MFKIYVITKRIETESMTSKLEEEEKENKNCGKHQKGKVNNA